MQNNAKAIQFNINCYHDFYWQLCHKRLPYVTKPYNNEHHELLKPSQQLCYERYMLEVPEGAFAEYVLKC